MTEFENILEQCLLDLELGGAVKGGAYAKDVAKLTVK